MLTCGDKSIEWRSWSTQHRGDLLICASSTPIPKYVCKDAGISAEEASVMYPVRVAVGVVRLADVRPFTTQDLEAAYMDEMPEPPGYAWVIEDPVEIEPFPVKGKLHLFEVDCQLKG
jgi:hypothetical protein